MNINNTFFGYTDNMKPMLKAKTENTLNNTIRFEGQVMTEKEWTYSQLQKGYRPAKEEDYQTYNKRTGEMTKPKTLYKLETADGNFFEVNKTLYDYACYIVSNGFLDVEKANEYITAELQMIEEERQAEAEREAKEKAEREELRAKQETEKSEKKRKLDEKRQAVKNGFTEIQKASITTIAKSCYENFLSMFTLYPYSEMSPDEIVTMLTERIESMVTDDYFFPEYVVEFMKRIKKEIEQGKKIDQRDEISYYIREMFFGIGYNMPPQTIRAVLTGDITADEAMNRMQANEQRKAAQEAKLVTFYRLTRTEGKGINFIEAKGERALIEGITVYVYNIENDSVWLIEEQTGLQISSGRNKTEAKKNLLKTIEKHGIEKVMSVIKNNINQYGLSPLLQTI